MISALARLIYYIQFRRTEPDLKFEVMEPEAVFAFGEAVDAVDVNLISIVGNLL